MSKKTSVIYVPWYSIAEWLRVKDYLLSEELEQWKRACQIMQMWKLRFPALPVNIECTLGVLQVIVQDHYSSQPDRNASNSVLSREAALVMEYSTTLVRFVNHTSADCGIRGDTLYLAALKSKIPDWIVNLRHDIAHGSSLPSLDLLRSAANFSVHWLLRNYWATQDENMSAFDGSELETTVSSYLSKLQKVLKIGITTLRQCCVAIREGRRFISSMNDEEWRSVTTFRKRLKKVNLVAGKELIDKLQKTIRKGDLLRSTEGIENKKRGLLSHKLAALIMNIMKLLTSSGPSLGKNLADSLLQTDFLLNEGSDWRQWKYVICLLDEADCLPYLIQRLFVKLASNKVGESEQAAGWLKVLASSLQILHQKYIKGSSLEEATDDDLIEFTDDCVLLKTGRPPSITLEMLKPALLNPTYVSAPVLEKFLSLLYPPLPTELSSNVKDLLNLFTEEMVDFDASLSTDVEILDVPALKESGSGTTKTNGFVLVDENETGKWKKVAIDSEVLKRYPLGTLPGQVMPELDLSDLVWRFYSANSPATVSN